jgi:hypothetical protein
MLRGLEGLRPETAGTPLFERSSPRCTEEVREEALKTLYRLRADISKSEESMSRVLRAIESLIEEYEQERS